MVLRCFGGRVHFGTRECEGFFFFGGGGRGAERTYRFKQVFPSDINS